MPAFARRMPKEDLDLLVDYVLSLRRLGDMGLFEAEQYRSLYALDTGSPATRSPED